MELKAKEEKRKIKPIMEESQSEYADSLELDSNVNSYGEIDYKQPE